MVIGHILQRYYVVNFTSTVGFAVFYSVSLGLFFFTSAHFIKRAKTLKELLLYLLKLIVTNLLPAYLFTVLSIFLLPRFADHNFGYWMRELYLHTDTFYWFFLTLVLINGFIAIGDYLISLLIKKDSLQNSLIRIGLLIILSVAYAQIFIYIYHNPELGPMTLASNLFLYYFPISLVGFSIKLLSPYYVKWKHVKTLRLIALLLCFFAYLLALINYQDWLSGLNGTFLDITGRMLGTLAGTLVYYFLSIYLVKFAIVKKLSAYAKYSGPFYLVHVFILRLLYAYAPRPLMFDGTTMLFICLFTPLFILGSLGITIILVEFIPTNVLLFAKYDSVFRFFTSRKKT